MAELSIMFMATIIILLGVFFLLFFKNGKLVKGKIPFILLQMFPLVLSAMYITSLPTNYLLEKLIGIALAIVVALTPLIKVKSFNKARIITIFTSILLIVLVYLA